MREFFEKAVKMCYKPKVTRHISMTRKEYNALSDEEKQHLGKPVAVKKSAAPQGDKR